MEPRKKPTSSSGGDQQRSGPQGGGGGRGGQAGSARGSPASSASSRERQTTAHRPRERDQERTPGRGGRGAHPARDGEAGRGGREGRGGRGGGRGGRGPSTNAAAGAAKPSAGSAQPNAAVTTPAKAKPAPWAVKPAATTADAAASVAASSAPPPVVVQLPSDAAVVVSSASASDALVLGPDATADGVAGLCWGSFDAAELPTARAPAVVLPGASETAQPSSETIVAVPPASSGAAAANGSAPQDAAASVAAVSADAHSNGGTAENGGAEADKARKPVVNAWGKGLPASLQKQAEINKQMEARQQRQQQAPTASTVSVLRHFDEVPITWQVSFEGAALRGLHNEGNTCFLNATVQCLLACPPFIALLRSLRGKRFPCPAPSLFELVRFAEAFEIERKSTLTVVPMAAKAHFGPVIKKLAGTPGRQEDAHEFLSLLMDTLHEELQSGSRSRLSNGSEASSKSQASNATDEWNEVGRKNKTSKLRTAEFEDTAITRIFGCKLRSCLRSRGAKQSITQELFHSLPLDVSSPYIRSLDEALIGFMSAESLDWDVKASKQYKFERMPGVLIVQFKRFAFSATGGGKITKPIEFSDRLLIPTGLLGPHVGTTEKERSYDLFGVVEHHGNTLHNGHYTAAIKRGDQWYMVDDTTITPTTQQAVLRKQAYLLFYLRTHNTTASSSRASKKS